MSTRRAFDASTHCTQDRVDEIVHQVKAVVLVHRGLGVAVHPAEADVGVQRVLGATRRPTEVEQHDLRWSGPWSVLVVRRVVDGQLVV